MRLNRYTSPQNQKTSCNKIPKFFFSTISSNEICYDQFYGPRDRGRKIKAKVSVQVLVVGGGEGGGNPHVNSDIRDSGFGNKKYQSLMEFVFFF